MDVTLIYLYEQNSSHSGSNVIRAGVQVPLGQLDRLVYSLSQIRSNHLVHCAGGVDRADHHGSISTSFGLSCKLTFTRLRSVI